MVEIDITIRGPQGKGKTQLANALVAFIRQQTSEPTYLIICSTNASDPCTYNTEHCGILHEKKG